MTLESRNNEKGSKNKEEKAEIRMLKWLVLDTIGLLRSLNEIHEIERRRIFHGLLSPMGIGVSLKFDYCIT